MYKEQNKILINKYINEIDEKKKREIAAEIVNYNYHFIVYFVSKYYDFYPEKQELINIGSLAILDNLHKYNPNLYDNFLVYMVSYIKRDITDYLNKDKIYRENIGRHIKKIKDCVATYYPKYINTIYENRKQLIPLIANKIKLSEYEIMSALEAMNMSNYSVIEDSDNRISSGSPESSVLKKLDLEEIGEIVKDFSEEEKLILMCIYEGDIDKNEINVDIINNKLNSDYSYDEIKKLAAKVVNKLRGCFFRKKCARKESDENNNTPYISGNKILDITDEQI